MPPMKLLAELAQSPLPRAFDDLDDVEKIRVLKAHGHVEATVPRWSFGFTQQAATVHAVTEKGLRASGQTQPGAL